MSDTLANALRGGSILDRIANPVTVNPLAAYAGALQTAQGVWANREAQARQAAGQAAQDAIDEAGNFVPTTANRNLVAAGPAAAMAAQEAIKNNQSLQGLQIEQAAKMRGVISNELGPVMALPDDQLGKGIAGAAARLRAAGIPEALIHQTLLNMPNDPAGQRQYLNQLRLQLAPPEQVQENIYGKLGTVTGPDGRQMGTAQSPTGAISMPPQQGAAQGLTTQQLNEVIDIPDTRQTLADGSRNPNFGGKIPITRRELLRRMGVDTPETGGTPSPMGSGRYPTNPALRRPDAPAGTGGQPPAPAPPAPAPAVPAPAPAAAANPPSTGLPQSTVAAQETTGTQSAQSFQDINKQGVAAQSQNALLSNMLQDAQNFTTGPLASRLLKVRQYAGQLGFNVDEKATSAAESFGKIAAQLAQAQNPGSDARMNISLLATPHADLSPGGVDLIIRQLQGNNDYLQARKTLAATWPDRADVAGFEDNAGKNLDPRAFQLARLQPGKQRADFLDSIKDPDEQKKLMKAYQWAQNRGLLGGQ